MNKSMLMFVLVAAAVLAGCAGSSSGDVAAGGDGSETDVTGEGSENSEIVETEGSETAADGDQTEAVANHSPVYDQTRDFNPDLPSSRQSGNGVALFNVPAVQITTTTWPLNAVIYGPANTNNLIDETGAVGTVAAGNPSGGGSLERTSSGWIIQAAPTPNDCSALLP